MNVRSHIDKEPSHSVWGIITGIIMALIMASASLAMEEGQVSYTARACAAFRAIGAHNPDPKIRNPDYLAEKMLGPEFWATSSLRYYYENVKNGWRINGPATLHYLTARTLHIDRALKQAVKDGAQQVVVLGAGFDSRAYRFRNTMPAVHFFEVDFPATLEAKLQQLTRILGEPPKWVRYAPIDFNKQQLEEVLQKAGFRRDVRTFFIWEGVTMYLDEDAVKGTLKFIARRSAPGSRVFFDYIYQPVIEGDYRYPGSRRIAERVRSVGEPYTYGIDPFGAEDLLRMCGLSLISDMGHKAFTKNYLIGSDGYPVGEPLTFLNFVLAQVPEQQ